MSEAAPATFPSMTMPMPTPLTPFAPFGRAVLQRPSTTPLELAHLPVQLSLIAVRTAIGVKKSKRVREARDDGTLTDTVPCERPSLSEAAPSRIAAQTRASATPPSAKPSARAPRSASCARAC